MDLNRTETGTVNTPDRLAEIFRGIQLTRAGKQVDAKEIFARLHNNPRFGVDVDESLALMLLEGLIQYYADCNVSGATDRLVRARALGVSAGRTRMVAHVCTWLAHLSFNAGDHSRMAAAAIEALDSGALQDELSTERLLLTVADAYSLSSDFEEARRFYDAARCSAIKIGDSVLIAAAAYNRSTIAISLARFSISVGRTIPSSLLVFLSELRSAENLESYLRLNSVLYPYDVWTARLKMLDANYSDALPIVESYLGSGLTIPEQLRPAVEADAAYCLLKLGEVQHAQNRVRRLLEEELNSLADDDLAVMYSHASQVLSAAGLKTEAQNLSEKMKVHRDAFDREARTIRTVLAGLSERVSRHLGKQGQ